MVSALEIEAEAGIHREAPPDTRGPSSPISATALWLGIGAIAMVLGGVLAVQLNYALSDRVLTEHCIEVGLTRDITGALGVCNIIEALRAQETTALLYVGAALGIAGIAVGFGIYRKMDTVRRASRRSRGAPASWLQVAVVLLVFRRGGLTVRQALPELHGAVSVLHHAVPERDEEHDRPGLRG
jgi:hypothetical protein